MSETVKATIIGTIIIGIFMLISVKMLTIAAWDMAHVTHQYIESQKTHLIEVVKSEQRKAKDVYLEGSTCGMPMKQCMSMKK